MYSWLRLGCSVNRGNLKREDNDKVHVKESYIYNGSNPRADYKCRIQRGKRHWGTIISEQGISYIYNTTQRGENESNEEKNFTSVNVVIGCCVVSGLRWRVHK